ncbi:MAG: hypothetical protein ACE5HA_13510 [Anaerolineae bacterium]
MTQRSKPESTASSFLLRLWLEPADGDEPPALRGYIRHVQSDAERYITGTDAILAFIEDKLPAEMREHFVDTP